MVGRNRQRYLRVARLLVLQIMIGLLYIVTTILYIMGHTLSSTLVIFCLFFLKALGLVPFVTMAATPDLVIATRDYSPPSPFAPNTASRPSQSRGRLFELPKMRIFRRGPIQKLKRSSRSQILGSLPRSQRPNHLFRGSHLDRMQRPHHILGSSAPFVYPVVDHRVPVRQ